MRKLIRYYVLCSAALIAAVNASATDCVNCMPTDASGMPKNAPVDTMQNTASGGLSEDDRKLQIRLYCIKFSQIPQEMVGATIRDMEKTPIMPEEFLAARLCQPSIYTDSIKSPMIHGVADDITKREEFLKNIWLYYSKKRKQPEIFDQIINSKNSLGETLLDYLETMRLRGLFDFDNEKAAYSKIFTLLCSRGAVYSIHKDKKCP